MEKCCGAPETQKLKKISDSNEENFGCARRLRMLPNRQHFGARQQNDQLSKKKINNGPQATVQAQKVVIFQK